ncbi:MAG TPA: hypothetical protein VMR14_15015 [Streptosporangiaceae bacterium]|jgi:hypothetical protein|nr:hypothetical protein [Streptosporangiaceae bacterium]
MQVDGPGVSWGSTLGPACAQAFPRRVDALVLCVLARNHRLVLRYKRLGPPEPSGRTDPALHILGPDGTVIATTDGSVYQISGTQFPVGNPAAAVR